MNASTAKKLLVNTVVMRDDDPKDLGTMAESEVTKRSYWIRFHIEECVLCGRTTEHRERVYDEPKPEDPRKRHFYSQYACGIHFA